LRRQHLAFRHGRDMPGFRRGWRKSAITRNSWPTGREHDPGSIHGQAIPQCGEAEQSGCDGVIKPDLGWREPGFCDLHAIVTFWAVLV
jgi:hypothetical protein